MPFSARCGSFSILVSAQLSTKSQEQPSMSVVRELPRFSVPGHCIMFPGRRRDARGFYLFDTVIDGPNGDVHIGISGEALRTIAQRHGARFGIAKREELDEWRTLAMELKNKV